MNPLHALINVQLSAINWSNPALGLSDKALTSWHGAQVRLNNMQNDPDAAFGEIVFTAPRFLLWFWISDRSLCLLSADERKGEAEWERKVRTSVRWETQGEAARRPSEGVPRVNRALCIVQMRWISPCLCRTCCGHTDTDSAPLKPLWPSQLQGSCQTFEMIQSGVPLLKHPSLFVWRNAKKNAGFVLNSSLGFIY